MYFKNANQKCEFYLIVALKTLSTVFLTKFAKNIDKPIIKNAEFAVMTLNIEFLQNKCLALVNRMKKK